jgi:hypothetical protein
VKRTESRSVTYYRMMSVDELIDCALGGTDATENWRDLAQVLAERLDDLTDDAD